MAQHVSLNYSSPHSVVSLYWSTPPLTELKSKESTPSIQLDTSLNMVVRLIIACIPSLHNLLQKQFTLNILTQHPLNTLVIQLGSQNLKIVSQ